MGYQLHPSGFPRTPETPEKVWNLKTISRHLEKVLDLRKVLKKSGKSRGFEKNKSTPRKNMNPVQLFTISITEAL